MNNFRLNGHDNTVAIVLAKQRDLRFIIKILGVKRCAP